MAEGGRRKERKEREGRKEKKRGKEKEGRKEKKKGKEKKKRKKENRNRKRKGKEIGKRYRKLGKLLGKLGGRICGVFRFPGVSVIFGKAVMARRTGRRDRGVCGIPAWWPTAVLGRHAWVMARVRAVPAGFAARAPRMREGESDRGFERAQRKVLKTRMIY
jgi:hypothetical protein